MLVNANLYITVGILIVIMCTIYIAHYYKCTRFKNANVMKDLGVIFDPDLGFVLHSKEKIMQCCAMFGIIWRNFMYLSEEAFVLLVVC